MTWRRLIDSGLQSLTNMDAEYNARSYTVKEIMQNCTKKIREAARPCKVNHVIRRDYCTTVSTVCVQLTCVYNIAYLVNVWNVIISF